MDSEKSGLSFQGQHWKTSRMKFGDFLGGPGLGIRYSGVGTQVWSLAGVLRAPHAAGQLSPTPRLEKPRRTMKGPARHNEHPVLPNQDSGSQTHKYNTILKKN